MRWKPGRSVLLFALVGLTPMLAAGQDEDGARAAVEQLFDGMRTADPDLVRSVLAADRPLRGTG